MKLNQIKFEEFSFVNPKIEDIVTTINQKISEDRRGKTRVENYNNINKILSPYLKRFNLVYVEKESTIALSKADNLIIFMITIQITFDLDIENYYYQFQPIIRNKKKERLFQFIKRVGEFYDNTGFTYDVE